MQVLASAAIQAAVAFVAEVHGLVQVRASARMRAYVAFAAEVHGLVHVHASADIQADVAFAAEIRALARGLWLELHRHTVAAAMGLSLGLAQNR